MRKIGIFGGSFDPVHEGHLHLAKLALDAANLHEVWFLPCRISPHKTANPPSSGKDRVKWLEIALQNIPWAKIEPIELETEGPSYSFKTIQELAGKHPLYEWFWIMGGDQWSALDRWKNPEIIGNHASFIVLARDGQEVEAREEYNYVVVNGEHPASSSAIRHALEEGEADIPYLNPTVLSEMRGGEVKGSAGA
ncbi:nicotinate (nicotinamide) nucleotide adenylyltransferase [Luteolibacter sp. AS25]|uniref:nicotinate (nicotinamide) nucleotide adenylyltransferase n=1 Tax=Luteolibacter sp. AS25 TaxID=3135776 RepID=UPI00398A972E